MSSHDKNDGRTHAEGCYAWGRNHYDCALGRIAELEKYERGIEHLRQQRDELLQAAKAALHYMRLHKYADQAWADDLERAIARAEGRNE